MPKVKTITLDGTETAVKFEKGYPYYVITNMGDSELYASGSPGITAYADGVYTILPGMEIRISPELSADTVFLLGSGMVQIRAEEIAVPTSFRTAGKGGGSGGVTDYSLMENKPSIGGTTIEGAMELSDFGITDFDGKYTSLNGTPVKIAASNKIGGNSWFRICTIKAPYIPNAATLIINVSYNRFSFVGILSYNC